MTPNPAPHTPQPSQPRRDVSDLEQLFGTSAEGVTAGLLGDDEVLGSARIRCMIPGCPDPATGALGAAPLPSISLGSRIALRAFSSDLRSKGLVFASFNCGWRLLWSVWRFLRQASGDDAYERYLEHMAGAHPGAAAMSRSQYFRFRQDEKWNRITRCC
jgi:uncharacterized short protein YbdD (DUF466 family)